MGNILVLLIFILAVVYMARSFYRGFKKQVSCGCVCTACDDDPACTERTKKGGSRSEEIQTRR